MKRAFECIRASIPACLALACLALQPAAQADTRSEKKKLVASVPVTYADLDLSRPADADVLLERIKKAAFRACGGDPRRHVGYDMMPARVEAVFKECREDAVARAIAEVNTPLMARQVQHSRTVRPSP